MGPDLTRERPVSLIHFEGNEPGCFGVSPPWRSHRKEVENCLSHSDPFLSPRRVDSLELRVGGGEESSGGKVLRLIQIRLTTPSLGKI
jgi:hypothetical protein